MGGGFTGIGMAVGLRQAGLEDFVILERSGDVGGTWRDNSYPGCAVDVQSHLYSYSFAPNPEWTHVYSPQPEIWDYIRRCSERFGIGDHVRYGHDVLEAVWEESDHRWHITTSAGPVRARFLISAMGPLSERAVPPIPGLDAFAGTWFHSAAWDHGHDLRGERVAVIGTGASAAQIIPAIQPAVGRLSVFQRTPPWTFPRFNRAITAPERAAYRRYPLLQRLARARQYWYRELLGAIIQRPSRVRVIEALMRLRLRHEVPDPDLRRRLEPSYRMGCKRIIVSDDYHRTMTRANVELITSPIRQVHAGTVETEDGGHHDVDTIILATGFHPIAVADPLIGPDGMTLAERWATRRQAYLGTTVAGYPNYFMLMGPNTATGHTSALLYAEAQIKYILRCLRHLHSHRLTSAEVREDRQEAYNRELRQRLRGSTWTSGGCGSWYLDPDGGSSVIWPGYTWQFRRLLRHFEPADYHLRASPALAPTPLLRLSKEP